MTRKFTAARRDAFLRALAATGNQTIAAERAKVSRSWVQLHQSTDPAFRAAMDAAIAEAKTALEGAAARRPEDPRQRWHDGAELVVRGSRGRHTQIARSRLKQWSPRVEARFLRALASCCNVKAACAEVGLTPASAYGHRERWPAFARMWDEAIENGYVRIEGALLEKAGNIFSETALVEASEQAPERTLDGLSVTQALHLLHMHKNAVKGLGEAPGLSRRDMIERARVSIRRKIEAIARHEAREAALAAQQGADGAEGGGATGRRGQGRVAPWPGERPARPLGGDGRGAD